MLDIDDMDRRQTEQWRQRIVTARRTTSGLSTWTP